MSTASRRQARIIALQTLYEADASTHSAEEVLQRNFLNLDSGLPVDQLRAPIRACLQGESEHLQVQVQATNRRGRAIHVRVTCTPLAASLPDVRGVILLLDEVEG